MKYVLYFQRYVFIIEKWNTYFIIKDFIIIKKWRAYFIIKDTFSHKHMKGLIYH